MKHSKMSELLRSFNLLLFLLKPYSCAYKQIHDIIIIGDTLMKSYVKKQLIRMRVYLIFDGIKRTEYIKKKNLFYSVGSNFFFQPRILPSDPKLIKFGNNVTVASNVTFINHDLIYMTLNFLNNGKYYNYYAKPIEIGDNVFIGSNSTILPNVKVGTNVVIAAGSIVTKDVENNSVVAGNPARKICTFEELIIKREKENSKLLMEEDIEGIWRVFNEEKNTR